MVSLEIREKQIKEQIKHELKLVTDARASEPIFV